MPERDNSPFRIVPHEWLAEVECCGCLIVESRGECGSVVRTVPAQEVESVLLRLAMNHGACLRCEQCGELNVIFGFDSVSAFTCRHCGLGNTVPLPVQ